jgi:hypothetical protein
MNGDHLTFPTCRALAEFLNTGALIPQYRLGDLITDQFCEAMVARIKWDNAVDKPTEAGRIRDTLARAHYTGGIAATEVEILKLLRPKSC